MTAKHLTVLSALVLVAALAAPTADAGVTFTINNVDPPGFGFNDNTPVLPVGGNSGTTLGQQRLIAFQFAADLWGSLLQSNVDVVVQATFFPGGTFFGPLGCTPTSATLGAAGTIQIFAFGSPPPGAVPFTWYHSALANKLVGADITPGPPDPGFLVPPFNDDIVSLFNDRIDTDPNCLTGIQWYYGLDGNNGGDINLVSVLLHEFAHGLGFSNFINEVDGTGPAGLPDIYTVFSLDNTTGQHWNTMTDAERATSARNCDNVVWDGAIATAAAPLFLGSGQPGLAINAPGSLAGVRRVGPASFGPPLAAPGVTGNLVLVDDGVGVGSDGCTTLTPASAAAVANNIALIDRGLCTFVTKVANAEAAGATAVVIADNAPGCPPAGLGGSGPFTIPSARITLADGNVIKAALPGVNATLGIVGGGLAGADSAGRVKLWATDPVQPGSSISHWDILATPSLLMEPAITSGLKSKTDLTAYLLLDEGWMLMNVVIDGCDTGVLNLPVPGDPGSIGQLIDECATAATNHGKFVSCVSKAMNELKKAGLMTGAQKGAIQSCAAGAAIP